MPAKRRYLIGLVLAILLSGTLGAQELTFDYSRARDMSVWKPQVRNYSYRHYGEYTWKLKPTCIVLHYTVTRGYPWNLTRTHSFGGETPGLGVHYIIDGDKIWETIPPTVRSRGCFGINHRAINIEMVAMDAQDLAGRFRTLVSCQKLCRYLMERFQIEKDHIYSHQDVATMDRRKVPEALDRIYPEPYHKIDPGPQNMRRILKGL